MYVVERRVFEEDDARRNLQTALDDVHGRPSTRSVGPKVRQLTCNVLEAAEGVELVLVVVVQRGFVPQPLPDRIGIVIDGEVERVVIHVGGGWLGHVMLLRSMSFGQSNAYRGSVVGMSSELSRPAGASITKGMALTTRIAVAAMAA